ncbi:MAG: hypothetical protein NC131_19985, partial [Roseburia sp.]|nr:hypothetical protein [Roseburia sp.]
GLNEYFCANYSDYVRISALEGYRMPEMLTAGRDGNIIRRPSEDMRLNKQEHAKELLAKFKEGLADVDFTFSFRFRTLRERFHDRFDKYTFAKIFPAILSRCDVTAEGVGEKLSIEPRFWQKIVKGKLYPEKNTVFAIALVCRMSVQDANNLLTVCGFKLEPDSVRDVVVGYLLEQKIFNPEMRDKCLAEYKITGLPIAENA